MAVAEVVANPASHLPNSMPNFAKKKKKGKKGLKIALDLPQNLTEVITKKPPTPKQQSSVSIKSVHKQISVSGMISTPRMGQSS